MTYLERNSELIGKEKKCILLIARNGEWQGWGQIWRRPKDTQKRFHILPSNILVMTLGLGKFGSWKKIRHLLFPGVRSTLDSFWLMFPEGEKETHILRKRRRSPRFFSPGLFQREYKKIRLKLSSGKPETPFWGFTSLSISLCSESKIPVTLLQKVEWDPSYSFIDSFNKNLLSAPCVQGTLLDTEEVTEK